MSDHGPSAPRSQGLELFFAMYAVGLVLGIEQISEALYKNIQLEWAAARLTPHLMTRVGLFLAILLLIVRFFWSTGNIRRAVVRGPDSVGASYLIFHLPILLIQGVLVLFVCFSFVDFLAGRVTAFAVIVWFVTATLWNAIWLVCLLGKKWLMPESFWAGNNAALAVIGAGLVAMNQWNYASSEVLLVIFVVISLLSSLLDLGRTATSYLGESGH